MSELTDKQKRFCEEYIVDLNATQAAIRAGYSKKTANEQGAQHLVKLSIQEYIQQLQKERSERTQITADRVIQELALIGFSNVEDFDVDDYGKISLNEGAKPESKRSIASIKRKTRQIGKLKEYDVEVKFWNKNDALKQLGMHLGIFEADNRQKTEIAIRSFDILPASTIKDAAANKDK